jgi:Domain of unknown function (DUF1707)/2TM domain
MIAGRGPRVVYPLPATTCVEERAMDREPGEQERRASLRASDADRERVVEALRQHHVDGRLDAEELNQRMDQAFAAKTLGELDVITTDLPPIRAPARAGAPLQPRRPDRAGAKAAFRRHLFTYAWVNGLLVVIWALTNFGGYFWPVWPMLGWGIGLASHAFSVYGPRADEDEPHRGATG